jgi:hypothetical protein
MTKKQRLIGALMWGSVSGAVLAVLFGFAFSMLNVGCWDDPGRGNWDAESQMCVP